MRRAQDRLTKHDEATIEAVGMGIGVMFGLTTTAFIVAVMAYLTLYMP